jgi:formamidopyrimidine-DNA glycosylase
MPELAEVESYRRLAEERALRREIGGVVADDGWYLKGGTTASALDDALTGRQFISARRRGKLLLLATSGAGPVVGLRFGMSGRLVVDGTPGVGELWWAPRRDDVRWDRFTVRFTDGGSLVMSDPRRLGGVLLDPPEDRLGPDALTVRPAELRQAVAGTSVALKARLLDQAYLAGVGNLTADEALWRAGLSPLRPAGSLSDSELRRLHRHLHATLVDFLMAGGSHTGRLMPERRPGGRCPKDHAALVRATVGGRTSWYCPLHQR